MACRLDVKKAIIKHVIDNHVTGREGVSQLSDSIIKVHDVIKDGSPDTHLTSIYADSVISDIQSYYNDHVMGYKYVADGNYNIMLDVSNSYVEDQYQKLPAERRTDPKDKELGEDTLNELSKHIDKLDDISRLMLKQSPSEFLHYVATQAHGLTEDGQPTEHGPAQILPAEIIDIAKRVYPLSSFSSPSGKPAIFIQPDCK